VTTVRAIAVSARGSWVWYTEELTDQCDIGGPVGIGEEAVVTDAVEPVGLISAAAGGTASRAT